MATDSYQIRLCLSCGLRYPLLDRQTFGTRCPVCLGETRLILRRELIVEPTRDLTDLSGALPQSKGFAEGPGRVAVLLDNIRSAWNVGSILRSAEGFGFAHAYLCGITSTPDGPAGEAVTKTSLGAEDSVTWSYHKDAVKLVKGLKKEGWKIFALEEDARAVEVNRMSVSKNDLLVVGNEVIGVDPDLLDLCDEILYIPMRGEKKSFNAAVAFSIAAYEISRPKI